MPKTAPLGLAEPMLPLPIAEPQAVGLSPAGLARLTGRLRSDIARGYLPGAVALIARRGRIAYFESLGALDPGKGTPMPADAIFRIYSMTKPIVSVAVMMLVEDGLVLVNDPLPKFLPEFAGMKVAVEQGGKVELVPAVRDITIQDLLRHTSGLAYEFRGTGPVQQMYLEAKTARQRVWDLLGRPAPKATITAYTISLGTPEAMAAATAKAAHRPLLKIKLGGDGDGERIAAVRKEAPESELIVDSTP